MSDGIISKNGVAILDDSKSLILKNNKLIKRKKCNDLYYFCFENNYQEDGTVKVPRIDKTEEEVWTGTTPLIKHMENHITGHSVYSKLYKREIVENIRFEEGRSVNEDGFFSFLCFAKAKKMVFLDTRSCFHHSKIQ